MSETHKDFNDIMDYNPHLRRVERKKGPNKKGGAGVVALGAAIALSPIVAPAARDMLNPDGGKSLKEQRAENTSGYEIPGAYEPHRIVFAGREYTLKMDGKERTYATTGADAMADYVFAATKGKVSFEDAKDYILAENAQFQSRQGFEVDALAFRDAQPVILPVEFTGAGQYVDPAKEQLGSGAQG